MNIFVGNDETREQVVNGCSKHIYIKTNSVGQSLWLKYQHKDLNQRSKHGLEPSSHLVSSINL